MTLKPLSNIDERSVSIGLDLRGWQVIARDGATLGTVSELIVDLDREQPVYIGISPDQRASAHGATNECWVRVPIRHATLDEARRHVVLSDIAMLGLGTATAGLRAHVIDSP